MRSGESVRPWCIALRLIALSPLIGTLAAVLSGSGSAGRQMAKSHHTGFLSLFAGDAMVLRAALRCLVQSESDLVYPDITIRRSIDRLTAILSDVEAIENNATEILIRQLRESV